MPASAADYALIAGTEIAKKDPAQARLLYIYRLAPAVRQYVDGKTPSWPVVWAKCTSGSSSWAQTQCVPATGPSAALTPVTGWPESVLTAWNQAGGWQLPARGLLMKVNLVPALIRARYYPWTQNTKFVGQGRLVVPAAESAGFNTTKWVAARQSLLWDSTQGRSTILALTDVVTNQLKGVEVTPAWRVQALAALASGEPYILSKHSDLVQRAIDAASLTVGEALWDGQRPTDMERNGLSVNLSTLKSALAQAGALSAQNALALEATLANLENAMAGAPGDGMPPPEASWWSRRATWQQVGIVLAGAGAAYYGYKHIKQRRAARNLLPA